MFLVVIICGFRSNRAGSMELAVTLVRHRGITRQQKASFSLASTMNLHKCLSGVKHAATMNFAPLIKMLRMVSATLIALFLTLASKAQLATAQRGCRLTLSTAICGLSFTGDRCNTEETQAWRCAPRQKTGVVFPASRELGGGFEKDHEMFVSSMYSVRFFPSFTIEK